MARGSQRTDAETETRRRTVDAYEEADLTVGALALVDHPIIQAARLQNHGAAEGTGD